MMLKIEYPNGCSGINVEVFFGTADKRQMPSQERQLVKQRGRLRWPLEQVQEMGWNS